MTQAQNPWYQERVESDVRKRMRDEPRASAVASEVAYALEQEAKAAKQLTDAEQASAKKFKLLPSRYLGSKGGV